MPALTEVTSASVILTMACSWICVIDVHECAQMYWCVESSQLPAQRLYHFARWHIVSGYCSVSDYPPTRL